MADVVHRTTREHLRSVNTPEFPVADWIRNPDMRDVTQGVGDPDPEALWHSRYWTITGDLITLRNAAARAVIDSAKDAGTTVNSRNEAKTLVDGTVGEGLQERALIHVSNKRENYLANRTIELQRIVQDLRDEIVGSVGNADAIRTAVGTVDMSKSATNTRTLAEAVTDYKDEIDTGAAD